MTPSPASRPTSSAIAPIPPDRPALPALARDGVDLYLKTNPPTHGQPASTGWRARCSLCLCNGWLHEGTTVVEASSGSTAVSEAYFARLLACHLWR